MYHKLFSILCLVFLTPLTCLGTVTAPQITYLGAFRMPDDLSYYTSYGGGVIAYNPTNNSLFITGHPARPDVNSNNWVGEISIPTPVISTLVTDLPRAVTVQEFGDVVEGNINYIVPDPAEIIGTGASGAVIGGLLVSGTDLIGSIFGLYDAGMTAVRSHFTSTTTVATTDDYVGNLMLGPQPDPVLQAGFIGGYMCDIPAAWQSALGGDILTGISNISIIGRTSYGPSAFSATKASILDATDISQVITGVYPMVYYDGDHQTLGAWSTTDPSNEYVSISDDVDGVVFPDGYDSILFIGEHGSQNCYGMGTTIESQGGIPGPLTQGTGVGECEGGIVPEGDYCCYDLFNLSTKGPHGYPMRAWVWAYDASDFADVKAGTKQPYEIIPYATWELPGLFSTYDGSTLRDLNIGGTAYDPATKRIYVTQTLIDEANGYKPVVHVYKLASSYKRPSLGGKLPSVGGKTPALVQ